MNAPMDPTLLERAAALQGMGDSRLRKEDARFIQGKGNYVDDIKMPGMLHMDIVRSPVAHARIRRIDELPQCGGHQVSRWSAAAGTARRDGGRLAAPRRAVSDEPVLFSAPLDGTGLRRATPRQQVA